ncbi:MAG: TatD family hydrolase [Promethearchaeota archaeon]
MRLIDVHSHLEWQNFHGKLDNVIINAKNAKLIAIITSSISLDMAPVALKIAERFRNYVFPTLGFAPSETKKRPKTFNNFLQFVKNNSEKIIAVGEVGLDYYWIKDREERKFSEECFIKSIQLSEKINKPLVIHCRDAEKKTIELLEEHCSHDNVHMHCFSGTAIHIKRCIKNGWIFSVPTSVVNRKSHKNLAKEVPIERMMLETDAPFLSPIKSEKLNEPKNIAISAKYIAELKGIKVEELAEITTKNALEFFSIKPR